MHGRIFILSLALAMWLTARPFSGIWHDSRFYVLQALHKLNPSTFSKDLFFLSGSQDQYSFFSLLHAGAISIFGLNQGTMVLHALGLGLWLVAAWALTRILPPKTALLGLILIVIIGGHYGSHGVFSYGESFLTARLYAEVFSLLGLTAWLFGRLSWGSLAFVVAGLVHPLIMLPALIIGLGLILQPKIWIGLLASGMVIALGLGFAGISPFIGLVHPMDSQWMKLASARSPFVFLHTWKWEGFSQALYVAVILATGWKVLAEIKLKQLASITLVCVLGAFLITYIGGSILKLPLIVGLQLTRAIWIAQIIALILIPPLIKYTCRRNIWHQMLAWGLALGFFLDVGTQAGYALLVLGMFYLGNRYIPDHKPSVTLKLLVGLIPLQIIIWNVLNISLYAQGEALDPEQDYWRSYFTNSATALVIFLSAYLLLKTKRTSKYLNSVTSTGSIVIAGLAASNWYDLKPELDFDSRARLTAIAPIQAIVQKDAIVYWVEEPDKAWFWLGRANYLSFSQTAGSVFSRPTAVEALRRASFTKPLSWKDSTPTWDDPLATQTTLPFSKLALQHVCSDPILDYVIAKSQPEIKGTSFTDPHTGTEYTLSDCREARLVKTKVLPLSVVESK